MLEASVLIGMKKLFAEEREWEKESSYPSKATLNDIWVSLHSFGEATGGSTFEELESELSRLRDKYGTYALLTEVEKEVDDKSTEHS